MVWLCLDWSMSQVHEYMVQKYAHMLETTSIDGSIETPSYEQIYKLTSDTQVPQSHQLDAKTTEVPIVINLINPHGR